MRAQLGRMPSSREYRFARSHWLFLLWLVSLLPAIAAHAEALLTITPSELALSPGIPEKIIVSVSGTPTELRCATLKLLPPTGLKVNAIQAAPVTKGSRGWIVGLKADASLIASSAPLLVHTQASLLSSSVKLSLAAAPAASSQFSAELVYDGESLLEKARGDVELRLTNLSDSTLAVTPSLRLPGFLTELCEDKPCKRPDISLRLAPGAVRVIDYRIAVGTSDNHPLTSGKHQISASVKAVRLNTARAWQGSQIVTRDIVVGIPGLGEVQALVGVPSFLLIPGFLICITAMALWRGMRLTPAGAGAPPSWTSVAMSPVLWPVAITLSMIVVSIYPSLSAGLRIPGSSRPPFRFDPGRDSEMMPATIPSNSRPPGRE